MASDTIVVKVPMADGGSAALKFRTNVLARLAAAARAEGSSLQDYLARRIDASGVGDEPACCQELAASSTTAG
jgi:hypothetical protein